MTAGALDAPKPAKWWFILIQGILAIVVGLLFLTQPVSTTKTAVAVLGAYWLILGILDIVGLFRDRTAWGWKLFTGIIGILAGGVILSGFLGDATTLEGYLTTAMVGVTIAWVIGFLGIMYGIIMLIQAFRGGGLGRRHPGRADHDLRLHHREQPGLDRPRSAPRDRHLAAHRWHVPDHRRLPGAQRLSDR